MPRPRFATADADLQRRILEAATREFTAKGYEAASLNRILLAAGLSKGSFYYYFDDKADLGAAVLAQLLDELKPLVEELGHPSTPREFWAALRRYTDRTMEEGFATQARLDLLAKLGMAYVRHPELMTHLQPLMTSFRAQQIEFIKRGQKIGAIRQDLSPDALINLMQAAKTSLAASVLTNPSPTRAELNAFTEQFIDLVKRMVKP
jgi:AcrR family transcriptional regulator